MRKQDGDRMAAWSFHPLLSVFTTFQRRGETIVMRQRRVPDGVRAINEKGRPWDPRFTAVKRDSSLIKIPSCS